MEIKRLLDFDYWKKDVKHEFMSRRFIPLCCLVFIALSGLIQSGCISHKLHAQRGLVGDTFRRDSLCGVPCDIAQMELLRESAYHRMNDVNYGLLHHDHCMDPKQLDEILGLKYELARLHRQGELLSYELRELLNRDPCAEQVEGVQTKDESDIQKDIAQTEKDLRMLHQDYMERHHWLMRQVNNRRPSLIGRVFMTQHS